AMNTITPFSNATCSATLRPRSLFLGSEMQTFGDQDVTAIYDAMITWLVGQQVQDKAHPHYGAVWYPSERRYDNRDTGCAALAYWRRFQATGEDGYKAQANLAREYVL